MFYGLIAVATPPVVIYLWLSYWWDQVCDRWALSRISTPTDEEIHAWISSLR